MSPIEPIPASIAVTITFTNGMMETVRGNIGTLDVRLEDMFLPPCPNWKDKNALLNCFDGFWNTMSNSEDSSEWFVGIVFPLFHLDEVVVILKLLCIVLGERLIDPLCFYL